ncbi:transcription antitermination factor NusB [Bacteroides heparinolyticus]|uniref:transcription antitermination factor NusB n=1 Tax=Prevotella heparinolytica TaxID=28113 RepID=UPI0035A130A4
MINRVLIRLKIIQIIYAYYQNGEGNLEKAEKELFFSLSKAYDLYNYLLLLMLEITKYSAKTLEATKYKKNTSSEETPNTKFVNNLFIAQLAMNKSLGQFVATQKRNWTADTELLKHLYEQIMASDIYKEYMATPEISYEGDREFWRKLYKNIIMSNVRIDEILEDQSLYWNDDKEIVDTFILKTIKRFTPENGAEQEILPEYKNEEDKEFASHLFRRSILNADYYKHLISENSKNWKLDRVAVMDVLLMQVALAEILSFPNIPVNVSLNEYVDIAKLYSTPRSGGFINGTLDGIVKRLKAENKLNKA